MARTVTLVLRAPADGGVRMLAWVDDQRYYGGNGADFRAEITLSPGMHRLKVRALHALELGEYTPWLFRSAFGAAPRGGGLPVGELDAPVCAALDAEISVKQDATLVVKLKRRAPAAKSPQPEWSFALTPSAGITVVEADSHLRLLPSLVRKWWAYNLVPVLLVLLAGGTLTAMGAWMAASGASAGGGVAIALLGFALTLIGIGCVRSLRAHVKPGYTLGEHKVAVPRAGGKPAGARAASSGEGEIEDDG